MGILSGSQNILNDKTYSLDKIPVTELFYENYNTRGVDAAMRAIGKEKDKNGSIYDIQEIQINNVGLEFLFMLRKSLYAIELFKLNAALFHGSRNVWDSPGEAYLTVSDKESALAAFERSYEINPDNKNAKSRIDEIHSKQ